jgi:amino-acid N-acetyltransferase
VIRKAEPGDLGAVLALLAEANLPADGAADHLHSFFVLDDGGRIVACAGLELHGDAALLRSVVVAPDARGEGLGGAVLRRALYEAHGRAGGVYALTTTAEGYLSRFGFARISRDALPVALFASRELAGACPDSAAVMKRVVP